MDLLSEGDKPSSQQAQAPVNHPSAPVPSTDTGARVEALIAALKAAGTDYDHVVKTACFLADMNDFAAFNKVYEKYFVSKPARSCVAVKTLPAGALCEIEAIAEIA